jgi:hypothetical protein
LRDLVIHSLVQVIINPDAKPNQITQAAKVLGTVTEVAAFTERKEVTTITSSTDAKAQIMAQLRTLMRADAVDVVEVDAGSLLAELNGVQDVETVDSETHPTATPKASHEESQVDKHTIPLKRSPQEQITDADPTPSSTETPPGSES